jgi:ABC-2 type transport system permease protein
MKLPAISPRRTYLIARQDFLGYIKTWGFWLTAIGPFLGILFGVLAPFVLAKSQPTQYAAILDETGRHGSAIERLQTEENERFLNVALKEVAKISVPRDQKEKFDLILEDQGAEAAKDFIKQVSPPIIARNLNFPESKLKFIAPPAPTMAENKAYVLGDKLVRMDGESYKLSGVLHIFEQDGVDKVEFWTTSPTANELVGLAERYFENKDVDMYLKTGGLDQTGLREVRDSAVRIDTFNPAKSATEEGGQKTTGKDRIPYIVAAALSLVLWFSVFTGAYMLLVSMVEEKINKVLEMLLASTRFSEIFIGKLIGVAALTLASLLPWIIMGIIGFYGVMQFGDGALVEGISKAISLQMMIFLPIFFILGYVFYGSMFIALGAMAESMQDASTLMTPMVLILTACVLLVPVGISFPESPILSLAAWVPFSAPFAAIIRLPANPPLWETLGSVLVLVVSSAVVIGLSSRLFKHGVLSGGGIASVKAWFRRVILRKA